MSAFGDDVVTVEADGRSWSAHRPVVEQIRSEARREIAAHLRSRAQRMTGSSAAGHAVAATLLDLADDLDGGRL